MFRQSQSVDRIDAFIRDKVIEGAKIEIRNGSRLTRRSRTKLISALQKPFGNGELTSAVFSSGPSETQSAGAASVVAGRSEDLCRRRHSWPPRSAR